jgi:hypothetical protein
MYLNNRCSKTYTKVHVMINMANTIFSVVSILILISHCLRSTKPTDKSEVRVTRTRLKTVGKLRCSGRVGNSCCTSGTQRCTWRWIQILRTNTGRFICHIFHTFPHELTLSSIYRQLIRFYIKHVFKQQMQ